VIIIAAAAGTRERRSMSFSTQILVGLAAGVVVGLFLGERAAVLKWAADGFVKLLQMTVLPYVTLSIVGSLGNLQMSQARELAWRGGAVLAGLWLIAITFALLIPLTFPTVETASFFSTTLVEQRRPFNFVDLYIPANPFYSLANNVVPAVVLFSIVVGVALIGIPRKQLLLDTLGVATEALARATRLIVRLTPYGLFAIAATTAGTISVEQVERLQVYLIGYALVSLLVSLWVLPGLVSALTPIPISALFSLTRNALITAFVAGDLFIVLPVLIGASGTLTEQYTGAEHASDLPAVIVPASFNFPHAGKLLSLSFVLFAGWFADAAVRLVDYPRLALMGILTFFGSLNVAVPFLLDQFRIPTDTFQLFLASGVINSRFGTLVAAMHTLVVALLGTCAMTGTLRWEARRLVRYAAVTLVLTIATIGGARVLFAHALRQPYTKDQVLAGMQLLRAPLPAVVHRDPPPPVSRGTSLLEDIRARGSVRIGYLPNSLPFAFFNAHKDLVGLDIEMAHRLAADLKVAPEFVPVDRDGFAVQLDTGICDIVMSGIVVTPLRASATLFSVPYFEETFGLVVRDEKRGAFEDWNAIKRAGSLTIAVPDVPYYIDRIGELLPSSTIRKIDDLEALLASGASDVDAIALPAERGSAWTLMYPRYTVVVPAPAKIRIPLAYPLARNDAAFARFVNTWVQLKTKDGTMDALYDYWILGRSAVGPTRRWSIMRNVLHWVD
jgi:Na+/H+-dicarboxylate symporter/ABC-type amino acid transport substrate-binding protein